jgi:hypothetical protein
MSRFTFDRQRAPADEYRQYYHAAAAPGSTRTPQRPGSRPADQANRAPDSAVPATERAVPQADGEP